MKSTRNNCRTQRQIDHEKVPVQVFCRLKPMAHPSDVSCMKIISDKTLMITPPENAMNYRNISKVIQTSFSQVFPPDADQCQIFNVVALPLLENLIHGKNGLLFTYGVTGSGKTYTMTGESHDPGIMPRCLAVLFNSISEYQARKFVFKPDRLNGFEVQSEEDALLDRQNKNQPQPTRFRNGRNEGLNKPETDTDTDTMISSQTDTIPVDEDNAYAVFVTYVEIYNNSVYDLLEEEEPKPNKPLQCKIIREDGHKNMYVHGVTEVEVKSFEEAFEMFQRGQRRRRVAYTTLNTESSRSHNVFTIRLVQAPLDSQGNQVVQDKRTVCISQLSLVDLAGSERTNRSKNSGQRLREAGNINNSLMNLRSCLEILRENQMHGTNKMVPYRDSKLTHLFKNYFDGEGQVSMIVCVNPRAEDYDETIQVMKFAEITQEIQVSRPIATRLDLGYLPGRRQANKMFREAQYRLERAGNPDAAGLEVDIDLVYSLGGPFPEFEVMSPQNDQVIVTLMRFLEQRIQKRNFLRANLQQKQNDLRNLIVKLEKDNTSLKLENVSLKTYNEQQKKKISALESHICKTEAQIDTLMRKLIESNDIIRSLQQELQDKDMSLNQQKLSKQKVKRRYISKLQAETEKLTKEMESKLNQHRKQLQNEAKVKDEKLKLVKQILDDNVKPGTITPDVKSDTNIPEVFKTATVTKIPTMSTLTTDSPIVTPRTESATIMTPLITIESGHSDTRLSKDKIPVVNRRYRRSQSAERWIDHRPRALVPVGTIFQPLMPTRRSVTQLTDPKDITDKASRYCLVAQEQDTDGELETKLYKGDILPTSAGGAQVIFNDVELLTQQSPFSRRKRSSPQSPLNKSPLSSPSHRSNASVGNMKKPRI